MIGARGVRRRRWLRRTAYLVLALGLVAYVEIRTFVLPLSDPPGRVDVVLVVGPIYNDTRLQVAKDYVRRHPGAVLLVSVDDPVNNCAGMTAEGARDLVCFRPEPFTTQGEGEAAGDYVREHRLWSVLVVAPPDQLVRAKLRVSRCTGGPVTGIASPRPRSEVVSLLRYQNGAMLEAQLLKRDC